MPTLLLVRHGRSTANTEGLLAGWTPGVHLDDRGTAQAADLPGRLAALPLAEVVTSPLDRCRETVAPLLQARPGLTHHTDERIGECHYGDWTGRKLAELKDEPLMEVVQAHPRPRPSPVGSPCAPCRRAPPRPYANGTRAWSATTDPTPCT